jgi:hypothetical protein
MQLEPVVGDLVDKAFGSLDFIAKSQLIKVSEAAHEKRTKTPTTFFVTVGDD